MRRIFALLAVCLSFAVVSCEKGPVGEDLGLARHDIVIDKSGGSILISSKADLNFGELHNLNSGTWEPSISDEVFYDESGNSGIRNSWLRVTKFGNGSQSGFIMIEASPNRTGEARACRIGVHNSISGEYITISQKR